MSVQTTSTNLPQDKDSAKIQVLAPDESSVASASIGGANVTTALPSGSEIVEVCVTCACRFAFGQASVDASAGTKRRLVTGVYVYRVPTGATHFAQIQEGAVTGTCTVGRLI